MPSLKQLFNDKPIALSISDYAAIGPVNGGAPWGDADSASNSIQIPTRLPIKTIGAAYTTTLFDTGTVFIITGAITFTLLDPVAALIGHHYWCYIGADVSVTFNTVTATSDKFVVFNDAAADSIAFSTGSQKIGNAIHFFTDGALWYAMMHPAITGGAQTAATPTYAT